MMPDAGHMLHHDQPELLARMIEEFLGVGRGRVALTIAAIRVQWQPC